MHLSFKYDDFDVSENIMHTSFVSSILTLSYSSCYAPFQDCSDFTDVNFLSGSQTFTVNGENWLRQFIIPRNDLNSFLHVGDGTCIGPFSILGSELEPFYDMTSQKN